MFSSDCPGNKRCHKNNEVCIDDCDFVTCPVGTNCLTSNHVQKCI